MSFSGYNTGVLDQLGFCQNWSSTGGTGESSFIGVPKLVELQVCLDTEYLPCHFVFFGASSWLWARATRSLTYSVFSSMCAQIEATAFLLSFDRALIENILKHSFHALLAPMLSGKSIWSVGEHRNLSATATMYSCPSNQTHVWRWSPSWASFIIVSVWNCECSLNLCCVVSACVPKLHGSLLDICMYTHCIVTECIEHWNKETLRMFLR